MCETVGGKWPEYCIPGKCILDITITHPGDVPWITMNKKIIGQGVPLFKDMANDVYFNIRGFENSPGAYVFNKVCIKNAQADVISHQVTSWNDVCSSQSQFIITPGQQPQRVSVPFSSSNVSDFKGLPIGGDYATTPGAGTANLENKGFVFGASYKDDSGNLQWKPIGWADIRVAKSMISNTSG